MSGSVVSSHEMIESLGLMGLDVAFVEVPSTFPVENRPLILAPVANMTYKTQEAETPNLAYAVREICAAHEGRVLVHTGSYALTDRLNRALKAMDMGGRQVFTHTNSQGKHDALRRYLATPNAVLLSPSCSRGVDLADDKCRVQIICKCPFPSLKDRQVNARLHLPGGQEWYMVQTVRDIIQMTGRGVRSETDSCITYILDVQFVRNIWAKGKMLFLNSFREAIKDRENVRWLIRPRS